MERYKRPVVSRGVLSNLHYWKGYELSAESLNHFKSVYGHHFFVKPADKNYFLARWSMINGFYGEFYWQAAQALEKYFKACLIMNDISVKKSGHDVSKLLCQFQKKYEEICPITLVKPEGLHQDYWRDEEIGKFIGRVDNSGRPDSRYGLLPSSVYGDDLFKLDQVCYHLKRCSVGLEWVVGKDWKVEGALCDFKGKKYKKVLQAKPEIQIRSDMEIPDRKANVAGDKLSDTLSAWNFAISPSEAGRKKGAPSVLRRNFGPWEASYLFLLLGEMEGKQNSSSQVTKKGVEWLLEMMRFPKYAYEELDGWLTESRKSP